MTASDCVFCQIVAGRAPASLVHRAGGVTAFLDIRPVAPGHLLVVSDEHRVLLADLTAAEAAGMFEAARLLAAALRRSDRRVRGINLFYADGEPAGQEVFHAHLHVIPRFGGDGFSVDAEAWRRPPPARAELDERARLVQAALALPTDASIP